MAVRRPGCASSARHRLPLSRPESAPDGVIGTDRGAAITQRVGAGEPESGQGQAHVPAEQPSAFQDARLPAAHAHARRPSDPRRPSPQGPRPAQRLIGATGPSGRHDLLDGTAPSGRGPVVVCRAPRRPVLPRRCRVCAPAPPCSPAPAASRGPRTSASCCAGVVAPGVVASWCTRWPPLRPPRRRTPPGPASSWVGPSARPSRVPA